MKKYYFLIIVALILGLVLTGCLLSNVGQVPTSEQSGIAYLTKGPGNLVGLWHFDEGVGTTAIDSSGNPNDGILMGGTGWTSGKFGNALSFDGVDDYVDCGNDESLDPGDNITIEAWIYPTSWTHDTYVGIVSKRDVWAGMDWELYYDKATSRIRVVMGNKVVIHGANTSPSLNAWHHLVYTKSGSVHKLYLDGVNTDTSTYVITVPTGDRVRIGLLGGDFPSRFAFSGTIDEVRIYDNALSQETIKGHAAGIYGFSGLLAPYAPPVEKAFKVGRTIPLKWQYTGPAGNVVDSASVEPIVSYVYINGENGNGILDEEDDAPGASGLQYDAFKMTWQFNWQTKNWKTGTYEIWITNSQTGQVNGPFLIELR